MSCSGPNELNGSSVKRAAESLHCDYASSALPDQRRLIDTLFNLQGTRGEAWGSQVGESRDSHRECFIYTCYHRAVQGFCWDGRTSCMDKWRAAKASSVPMCRWKIMQGEGHGSATNKDRRSDSQAASDSFVAATLNTRPPTQKSGFKSSSCSQMGSWWGIMSLLLHKGFLLWRALTFCILHYMYSINVLLKPDSRDRTNSCKVFL